MVLQARHLRARDSLPWLWRSESKKVQRGPVASHTADAPNNVTLTHAPLIPSGWPEEPGGSFLWPSTAQQGMARTLCLCTRVKAQLMLCMTLYKTPLGGQGRLFRGLGVVKAA